MKVGKLADNSMHGKFINATQSYCNVVIDCYNNFIVSMPIAEGLLAEYGYPYEEIDFCPYVPDEDEEG